MFEGIGAPRCIVCKKEQWLGSVSVGLAPQKPRLAGVKLVFLGFFVLTNPSVWMVHCCGMVAEVPYGMHTRKRGGP